MKRFPAIAVVVLSVMLVSCASKQAAQKNTFTVPTGALAMMFQSMTQFEHLVATHDLASLHNEDAIISAAINDLLMKPAMVTTEQAVAFQADLTTLAQQVTALHEAGDLDQQKVAEAALLRVEKTFTKVKAYFPASVLAAARQRADRYTCPMHPDIIGKKDATCPKCDMALDQMVRILPASATIGANEAVAATVRTEAPLKVGEPATAYIRLSKPDGWPVCLPDLIETHTKKIHLLIIDSSLTDYHHEHPEPTEKLGEYTFHFTPRKPGSYRVWADLRVNPLGFQQYAVADFTVPTTGEPLTDRTISYKTVVEGLTYELFLDGETVRVGKPMHARLKIMDAAGKGFAQLEPIMATFAHLVGFNEDYRTVMHIHPKGAPVLDPNARGGPELEFQIYALKPGFVRLFAQVQIGGVSKFAPFGIEVAP